MSIIDDAKTWLFKIAIKKAIVRIATVIVAYASAHGIKIIFNYNGYDIDTTNIDKMTLALTGLYEIIRNYLKTKFPDKFGWL